ncbi:S1 family peptidase [Neptunomonas antarctica]|uniref:Trypsin-like peptidase domain-containing protein n=1 Tax=Neptunomonas antarctica TaxID=619304 RepID=A0A1N7JF04_9GAMM|nr:serine protease [Neptunomonas antarctica]SIS47880.1 Trypsin-like peptidase domain-containing protein [Neptunomonas antarctica]
MLGKNIFIGCAGLWVAICSVSVSAELADTIDQIRGSIVAVGSLYPNKRTSANRPKATYSGTGFVVGNGHQVITNYHVISAKELDVAKGEKFAIFSGRGKAATARSVRVVRTDVDHDLALLEFDGPALPAMKLAGATWLREGREVAFTGFPIGMVLGLYPVTHKGIISAVTPIVIPAQSSRQLTAAQIKRLRSPLEVYQLDAIAYPGNSGSPVYEQDTGKVVGVVNSVFVKGTKESALEHPSGISYAIPVKYVQQLMNK